MRESAVQISLGGESRQKEKTEMESTSPEINNIGGGKGVLGSESDGKKNPLADILEVELICLTGKLVGWVTFSPEGVEMILEPIQKTLVEDIQWNISNESRLRPTLSLWLILRARKHLRLEQREVGR